MTRRRLALAALAALTLVAIVAAVWFVTRDDDASGTFEPVSEYDLVGVEVSNGLYGITFGATLLAVLVLAIAVVVLVLRYRRRRRGD